MPPAEPLYAKMFRMTIPTTPHITILTGASRGMGHAMAEQLLGMGHTLLCISRQENTQLTQHPQCTQWALDLQNSAPVAAELESWLASQNAAGLESVNLINNAGVVAAIAPLSGVEACDISLALRVGLEAPMQLTAAFLRATASWQTKKRVLNISSGLGRRAMASQTGYCAAKAGMDHFTRCLALEEALKPHGAQVCSLAPGVIDTDMQVQLRSADAAQFPDRAAFESMKTQGVLTSVHDAASRVLDYMLRKDFGSNPVGDVRDVA